MGDQVTRRQSILKRVYPLLAWYQRIKGRGKVLKGSKPPVRSLYDLSVGLNNGDEFLFSSLKGKKVLLVNTASDCGYTDQYSELQKLYERYTDKLLVIGFPANNFKEQEKGNDEEIAAFCKMNYGISFPLAKKSDVIGKLQNEIFNWLTHEEKNGWCNQQPEWNFSKYLVNEKGELVNYFAPSISPLSSTVINAIKK